MRKLTTSFAFLLVAATSGGATECGQIVEDPGFDAWCGDSLCSWTLEAGAVERAPTWHAKDNGVSMVGASVAISQLTEVDSFDGHCVAFDLVADVATDAEVRLQMDVSGDGSIDYDERLPSSDWRALAYRVRMPETYVGVRFRVVKQGGHAVLANIGISIAPEEECTGAPVAAGAR